MKIHIITQYYYPEMGAAAVRWKDYSILLAEMGHDVTVICERPNYPSGTIYSGYKNLFIEKHPNYNHTVIRTWVIINQRSTFFQRIMCYTSFMISSFFAGIQLPKADMYIVSSPPLFAGITGYILSILRKTPLIFDIRDLWPETAIELGKLNSWLSRCIGFYMQSLIYRQSSVFIVPVPGMENYLRKNKYINKKPILTLMNGVNEDILEYAQKKTEMSDDTIKIIYAGNIGLAQDIETVINAAQKLNNSFQFLIIGDGVKKQEYEALVIKKSITNVKFLPPLSRDELLGKYHESHIGIVSLKKLPIFKNAIPSKTMEYLASGLYVICMVKGEIEAIIRDSNAGICIDPENVGQLVNSLKSIEINEIISKGMTGKEYIQNNLRKKDLIRDIIDEIKPVVNSTN